MPGLPRSLVGEEGAAIMPIYVYRCPNCGTRHDLLQRHDAQEPPMCLECDTIMRLELQPPALRFRGDGWQTPSSEPVIEGEGDGG